MSDLDEDRTASLMTPAKLAQLQVRPRPAASPAAWLDALASDAGSGHVRRLVDLRGQLEAQWRGRGYAAVSGALQELSGALGRLDFAQVQPRGWLARATGKGKEAAAIFVKQVDHAGRAGDDLADEVRDLHKAQQAAAAGVERAVLEMEVEVRAIERIMDQGARWLQDMRNQLKVRQAEGGDAAVQHQIDEDTRRCDLLLARLKQLRTVSSAAQQALAGCREVAPKRAALVAALQGLLEGPWRAWQKRAGPVADEVRAAGQASQDVGRALAAQEELQGALQQAAQDCASLQAREQELAAEFDALREPLQAAA